jgi:hypothetical protein
MMLVKRSMPTLALAALLAGVAPAAQAKTQSASCGSSSGSFLFWPKGHGKRPKAGFPEFRVPHLELYAGKHTTSFPDAAQDAYLDATGAAGAAKRCTSKAGKFVGASSADRTSTAAANLQCAYGGVATYRLGKTSYGSRLQVVIPAAGVVVDVKMRLSGSTIAYASGICKAQAPPE